METDPFFLIAQRNLLNIYGSKRDSSRERRKLDIGHEYPSKLKREMEAHKNL
jgi:hypothetical protein